MTGTFSSYDRASGSRLSWSFDGSLLGILADNGYQVELQSDLFRCPEESRFVCHDNVPASPRVIPRVAWDFARWFFPQRVTLEARDLVANLFPREVIRHIPVDIHHRNSRSLWYAFLDRVSGAESPGKAYFVRILIPHFPYEFDRTGTRAFIEPRDLGNFPKMASAYKEQVMFVDRLLGEFVAKLKTEGLYDRSVVIVTGDHGPRRVGLGSKFNGVVTSRAFPEEIKDIVPRVSLIIHAPGIRPQVSRVDYQHVDLLPTVLDILGLPSPPDLHGVSAFAVQRPSREKVFWVPTPDKPGGEVAYVYDEASGRWQKTDPTFVRKNTGSQSTCCIDQ